MSQLRLRIVALVVGAVLVTVGCQADVTVSVDVGEDGAGTVGVEVQLDGEAVERLEGIDQLRTEDLEDAGWTVSTPEPRDDGGVVLTASKPFADPAELGVVLEEVSGPGGPYARLGLSVDRPFARSEFVFEGVLDGSVGVDAFADPQVAGALDGLPFGQDLAALEADLGAPPGSFVHLRLVVSLPGEDTSTPSEWETDLVADAPVPVLATSEVTRTRPLLLAGGAAVLAALALVLLVLGLVVSVRRRRRRRRAARARAAEVEESTEQPATPAAMAAGPGEDAVTVAEDAAAESSEEGVGLEMVVLGGPGATFGVRDVVDELVAFARSHGSLLEYPRIADRYDEASRGQLSTAELWEVLGVAGDPEVLDEEMLGRYQLTSGAREFIVRARDHGYRVAYLGDGPAAWAGRLRRSFRLDDLVDPWVVSGEIGAVLPELAMFEALRRISTVAPESSLLIDDRLRVLEAARELGFGTAWFTPSGRATEAPGHSIIRSFEDLLSG